MEIRPLDATSPAELSAVLTLFKTVYRYELDEAFYRWRFLENPFGSGLVSLLWDGPTLAGHYAIAAMRAWSGEELLTGQSMTTMTHPDYRNRGVFTMLADDLYQRMERSGYGMVWGFPNTQSHYGFITKLGWHDVAVMFTMTRILADVEPAGAEIEELSDIGAIDHLWERSREGRFFFACRDARYLSWRYRDNPNVQYRLMALRDAASDVVVVCKDYATASGKALEVVDYLYAGKPRRCGEMMRALLAYAKRGDYSFVRTWMLTHDPAFGELEKLGFVPKEPLAYCGARWLGTPAQVGAAYVTMGDSDNY